MPSGPRPAHDQAGFVVSCLLEHATFPVGFRRKTSMPPGKFDSPGVSRSTLPMLHGDQTRRCAAHSPGNVTPEVVLLGTAGHLLNGVSPPLLLSIEKGPSARRVVAIEVVPAGRTCYARARGALVDGGGGRSFRRQAMSSDLGPIDVVCDAPSYPVVRACGRLGFHDPQDVRWCRVNRFAETPGKGFLAWIRGSGKITCNCG